MKRLLLLLFMIFLLGGCGAETDKSKSYFKTIKEKIGKEAMVLEIGASSCKTCINMKKTIDALKLNNPNLPIHIIDVYDDMSVFSYFKIQMIPTQVVINEKDQEVYRHIGGLSGEEMLKLVKLSKKY